ncbi:sialate O-acetylesterase [Microbulbifer yueqingensis]|uniref:Sialate O-acetylesterase domain-containing protein n=1 Tax=Microbulbifer yueqingensis TaxID=658219 RepID=A0A1G9DCD2_9GAMM|nr:sialate O-acetylesterase [Microbulbifer yueqingensis]SDK61510.1 protein of unknown function [Microbulbifer yueqingensis]
MRAMIVPLFSLWMGVLPAAHAEPGKHLFILSGQSNMARLDVDAYFTPLMEARLGRDRVIVVKDAEGGQPIARWYRRTESGVAPARPGNDLYTRLLEKVRRAVGRSNLLSVTFVWMQGERDARSGMSETYAGALAGLLAQLEADLGRPDINVVIGRLSDHGLYGPGRSHWRRIREIQVHFAESRPRGAWVDTDDLNDGRDQNGVMVHNDLHLTPAGYRELGARFAARAQELLQRRAGGYRPVGGPGPHGAAVNAPSSPGDRPE